MLRIALGWFFCLAVLLLGSSALRVLAAPRPLSDGVDLVYLDQLLALAIAGVGYFGLLIAFLLRASGRYPTAVALIAPAIAACTWNLVKDPHLPVSPNPTQCATALAALIGSALILVALELIAQRSGTARTVMLGVGWLLLLPWLAGLYYLARLYR